MSISHCGYDGTAIAQHKGGVTTFIQADPKIHIADELIDQDDLDPILFATYKLGRWCDEVRAWHADLIELPHRKDDPMSRSESDHGDHGTSDGEARVGM